LEARQLQKLLNDRPEPIAEQKQQQAQEEVDTWIKKLRVEMYESINPSTVEERIKKLLNCKD
jgi:hypothetical protein